MSDFPLLWPSLHHASEKAGLSVTIPVKMVMEFHQLVPWWRLLSSICFLSTFHLLHTTVLSDFPILWTLLHQTLMDD